MWHLKEWARYFAHNVATRHLHEAPVEKAEWLLEVLPPKSVAGAMSIHVKRWVTIDLPAAAEWLKMQDASAAWRASAVKAFDQAVRAVDSDAADAWRTEIER